MKTHKRLFIGLMSLGAIALILGFQNCAQLDVGESGAAVRSPATDPGAQDRAADLKKPPVARQRLLEFSDSSAHEDDPALLLGKDGYYYVVFILGQGGESSELWLTRSKDTLFWEEPIRLTDDTSQDIYPSLVQTDDGVIHLVWAKMKVEFPFTTHLFYASYVPSGGKEIFKSVTAPQQITDGPVDDSFPSLVLLDKQSLRIYFNNSAGRGSSSMDIYSMDSGCGDWCEPVLLSTLSTDAHDLLPIVVRKASGEFVAVFQKQTGSKHFLDSTAEIHVSKSTDGIAWGVPRAITFNAANPKADVIPSISLLPDGLVFTWTSTAYSTDHGQGGLVMLSEEDIDSPESAVVDLLAAEGMHGWSIRSAAADARGNVFQVWVSKKNSAVSNIWGRFVEKKPSCAGSLRSNRRCE